MKNKTKFDFLLVDKYSKELDSNPIFLILPETELIFLKLVFCKLHYLKEFYKFCPLVHLTAINDLIVQFRHHER